jgi:hypothetical protein
MILLLAVGFTTISSMLTSLTNRVEELENQVKVLFSLISKEADSPAFIPTTKAALELGVHPDTLKRHIKYSKAFPKESPYKEGIHWEEYQIFPLDPEKKPIARYQINPTAWREVCTKVR